MPSHVVVGADGEPAQLVRADHVDHRHRRLHRDPVGQRGGRVGGVQVVVPAVVADQLGDRASLGEDPR